MKFEDVVNVKYKNHEIIGVILSVFSFGIVFVFNYLYFFENKSYNIRKRLLEFLETTELPKLNIKANNMHEWKFDKYSLILWNMNSISIHDNDNSCLLSTFTGDVINKKRNDKIVKILCNTIKENKND